MSTLTAKQQRFVDEYLIDLNATQAAIRAGYEYGQQPLDQYYTYLLIDPRDGKIFYVGKGKGGRIGSHVKAAKRGQIGNACKHRAIKSVLAVGLNVLEVIFSIHSGEAETFAVERALIHSLRGCGLTNIVNGTVSSEESSRAWARNALERLKPFQKWLDDLDQELLAQVKRVFGSPESCYRSVHSSLTAVANWKASHLQGDL